MKTTAVVGVIALLFAATVPTLSQNALQFTAAKATEEKAILLSWQSEPNALYRIQYASELSDQTDWETLADLYPSHGTNTFILDTGDYFRTPAIPHPRNSPARFYQVVYEGTNGAPPPQVAVTSPSNGSITSGKITITVAASTDQATLLTRLYVDGQEMRPAVDSTNYTDNGTNYLNDDYVINTCEWPNGPHTLFAVAECASGFAGPLNATPVQLGHGVSPYVPVTFSNLISRFSWSEPFFRPALGQTQIVSAAFAANVDWTLQMLDTSSNAVRTVTGSGKSLQYAWDGTGQGGTNLPAGVYTYQLFAQTNGLSSLAGTTGSGDTLDTAGPNASVSAPDESNDNLLPPMPPELVESNGVWTPIPWNEIYGLALPADTELFLNAQPFSVVSVAQSTSFDSESISESSGFGGASPELTSGPTRPPDVPMVNIIGTFAVGFQQYINPTGTGLLSQPVYMQPPLDGQPYPPGHRVQLMGSSGSRQILPIPYGAEALNFGYEMHEAAWIQGFFKYDGELYGDDLRYFSSPFNTNNIGLLLLHGAYGTSADWYADQCQQIYFPLWSFGIQKDGTVTSREEWVRMSEMNFGSPDASGLKWMAIMACYSLRQENVASMGSHFVYPFNSNLHLMLGVHTIEYSDSSFGAKWARYMVKTNLPVWDSWVAAGKGSFVNIPSSTEIDFAVWGHSGNLGDRVIDYTSSPSGDLDYRIERVHPLP